MSRKAYVVVAGLALLRALVFVWRSTAARPATVRADSAAVTPGSPWRADVWD
ncbi:MULTISPECIES: hypothetical protein [Corallococcus]|uniref:hypothetical protein n=1 Tax=Corallococcus TaxID=83461 RepID=UPI0013155217|nr:MULTISPECIES: hypothetical protein [Corallococcus]